MRDYEKGFFSRNQAQTRGQSNNSHIAMCHAVDNARTMTGQERHQPTTQCEWLSFPRTTSFRGQTRTKRGQTILPLRRTLRSCCWLSFLILEPLFVTLRRQKVPVRFKKHTCPTNAIHRMPLQWPSSSHCNAIF